MADHLIRYLVETEIHLRRRMDPARLQETMDETEQHLRDRVSALQELGMSEPEAEREAVETFGPSWRYAAELLEAQRPPQRLLDRKVIGWSTVAMGIVASQMLLVQWHFWQIYVGLGLFALAMVLFSSTRSHRVLPGPVLAIVASLSIFGWLVSPLAYANLGAIGGLGYLSHREVEGVRNWLPTLRQNVTWIESKIPYFQDHSLTIPQAAAAAGVTATKVSEVGGYHSYRISVPAPPQEGLPSHFLSLIAAHDNEDVERGLGIILRSTRQRLDDTTRTLRDYQTWQEGSYGEHLLQNRNYLSYALGIGLLGLLGANLFGVWIGRLAMALNRRRMAKV